MDAKNHFIASRQRETGRSLYPGEPGRQNDGLEAGIMGGACGREIGVGTVVWGWGPRAWRTIVLGFTAATCSTSASCAAESVRLSRSAMPGKKGKSVSCDLES